MHGRVENVGAVLPAAAHHETVVGALAPVLREQPHEVRLEQVVLALTDRPPLVAPADAADPLFVQADVGLDLAENTARASSGRHGVAARARAPHR